jgi:hypothetical protein
VIQAKVYNLSILWHKVEALIFVQQEEKHPFCFKKHLFKAVHISLPLRSL